MRSEKPSPVREERVGKRQCSTTKDKTERSNKIDLGRSSSGNFYFSKKIVLATSESVLKVSMFCCVGEMEGDCVTERINMRKVHPRILTIPKALFSRSHLKRKGREKWRERGKAGGKEKVSRTRGYVPKKARADTICLFPS